MISMITAREYLVRYGIKPSVQRIAIMEYLITYRIHPCTDEIYSVLLREIPTLSKTTVYNTLKLFTEQGALIALGIDDRNIRYDIDVSDHAHFLCLGCGKVYDIPVEQLNKLSVYGGEELRITETHLYYKGYCKLCENNKASNNIDR